MARRGRSNYARDDYDEGAGGRGRRRRGGGYEGLYIALGAAGVVGIIAFFVLSSSSSGDEEKVTGKAALRELFQSCVQNDPKQGMALVDPRQIIGDINPKLMKGWHELTDAEKQDYQKQAWNLIRQRIEVDLEVKSMADADRILDSATPEWHPSLSELSVDWSYLGREWRARLVKADPGWLVINFRQETAR